MSIVGWDANSKDHYICWHEIQKDCTMHSLKKNTRTVLVDVHSWKNRKYKTHYRPFCNENQWQPLLQL